MKIPKILILLMSCHDKVFLDEEILCKNTWLKFVDNFDNINYYTRNYDEYQRNHCIIAQF